MVDNRAILLALRNRVGTLSIAATGETVLEATATGYARASGSFEDDGFLVGMEVAPQGFAGGVPNVVTEVSALSIRTRTPPISSAAAPGRSIEAGLPSRRAWENVPFDREAEEWYIREEFIPGPPTLIAGNYDHGEYDADPAYIVTIYGLPGTGAGAVYAAADALLRHVRPGLHLPTSDGHTLRVRTDTAPYRGQLFMDGATHAAIEVTIPLTVRTTNTAP